MTIVVGVVVLEITMLFLPCMPGRSGEENLAPHLTQSQGGLDAALVGFGCIHTLPTATINYKFMSQELMPVNI